MSAWLDKLRSNKSGSAGDAKERLKLVLIHDRTNLSAKSLQSMKNELIDVISRYVAIDPSAVTIDMTQEGREQRLVADIPIRVVSKRRTR